MIKLLVIGNLGRDAVVNNVNGRNVINFSVAHTDRYKDSQGVQKERTTWVECAYWTDRTAIAPYLKRGTQVYAEGAPDVRAYSTPDGRQGTALTLRVMHVQLLGSRNAANTDAAQFPPASGQNVPPSAPAASPSQQSSASQTPGEISEPLDDLPF